MNENKAHHHQRIQSIIFIFCFAVLITLPNAYFWLLRRSFCLDQS